MRYYPAEFIAAMLNSVMGGNEKVAFYIRYANTLGIEVLPPEINESNVKFTVKGDKIRFGLAAIKNVGVNVIESIVKSREAKGRFISFMDFCNKIDMSDVNKRAVESLIKSGAFDSFKIYRSRLLAVFEKVLDGISSEKKRNIDGQISLFSTLNETFSQVEIKYPEIQEFDKKYILAMEKEMTGLYLSGHPLDEFEDTLNRLTNTKTSDITVEESLEEELIEDASAIKDGDRVILGGIISEISRKVTRKNDMMAFIKLEDLYGSVEVLVFPKVFERCRSYIYEDALITLKGRVSIREDEQPKVLCEEIEPLVKINNEKLYLLIEEEKLLKEAKSDLKSCLAKFQGNTPVYLCTRKERTKFRLDRDLWVKIDNELMQLLKSKFGEQNVKIQ